MDTIFPIFLVIITLAAIAAFVVYRKRKDEERRKEAVRPLPVKPTPEQEAQAYEAALSMWMAANPGKTRAEAVAALALLNVNAPNFSL